MGEAKLSPVFLAAASGATADDALETALRARVDAGRAAWPAVPLEDEAFVRHLAAHADKGQPPPLEHAGELWIACACASNVPGAARLFQDMYRSAIERAVARVDRSVVDETTQVVLTSLLVREPSAAPRIAEYAGRAALRTWLATVAGRAALKQRRRKDDQPHEGISGLAHAAVRHEPELAIAVARYGPEFEAALRESLVSLAARDRVLLRLNHADGWSIDRIAAFYGVGRSSAARWLVAARERLYAATKRALRERLQVTSSEFESLAGLLQSGLEVSLVRLLRTGEETDESEEP